MQRRHFEAIAQAIREVRMANPYGKGTEEFEGYEMAASNMVREMLGVCKRANPNFDGGRFREACEVDTKYRNKSDNRKL